MFGLNYLLKNLFGPDIDFILLLKLFILAIKNKC